MSHCSPRTTRAPIALALGLSALAAGCSDDGDGEAGRLAFAFLTDDTRPSTDTAIAVGGQIALEAFTEDADDAATLVHASSESPEVIDVLHVGDREVLLEARGEGTARISVTAQRHGQDITDSVVLEAATPARAAFVDACDAPRSKYLASSPLSIPLVTAASDGRELTGWGALAVDVEPGGALELDEDARSTRVALRSTEYVGEATLSSDLAAPLTLDVVPESAISGARLDESTAAIARGTTRFLRVVPTIGNDSLCQGEPRREVVTDTLDVCSASEEPIDPTNPDAVTWVRVEGFERGTCRFSVRYPEGGGGQGITRAIEIEVR